MRILLLEGPNLNLVGIREPDVYGRATAEQIHEDLRARFAGRCELETFQSNHEGDLIERVQAILSDEPVDALVVNAGSLTHTSIGLRDALAAAAKPFVEVHLSNIYARESFRHHSTLADQAVGVIAGLGPEGYAAAIAALLRRNGA